MHGHFRQSLHQPPTLARERQGARQHQRVLERVGLEREPRQVGARRPEEDAAGVSPNGIGEREGIGVAQHEAQPQSEHLRGELLRRHDIPAVREFGEEQHRHGAGRITQHEAHEGV